jgi:fibronectin-binding autotransporter adhesin
MEFLELGRRCVPKLGRGRRSVERIAQTYRDRYGRYHVNGLNGFNAFVLYALWLMIASSVRAQDDWNVPSGDWTVGSNWSTLVPPTRNVDAFIQNGGTATIGGNDAAVAQSLHLGGPLNGALTITGGTLDVGGFDFKLGADGLNPGMPSVGDGTLTFSGGTITVNSNLNVGGNGNVPPGAGTGGNGADGTLIMSAGLLRTVSLIAGGNGGSDQTGGTGGNGVFLLKGGTVTVSRFGMSLGGSGGASLSGGTGGNGGNGTFTLEGGTLNVSGTITLGGLTLAGRGSGGTGTLNFDHGILTATTITVAGNGAINFGPGAGQTVVVNSNITGLSNKTVTLSTPGTVDLNGTTDFGSVVINSGSTLQLGNGTHNGTAGSGTITDNGVLRFDFNGRQTIANNIQGSGTVSQLAGTTLLTGSNTYSGMTTLIGGTLQAGSSTAFSQNSSFVLSPGTTLDLHGFSNTISALTGAGTVTNASTTSATLTDNNISGNTSFGGVLTDGTGTLAFIERGTGIVILTGTNTYTGGTTISGGTLQLGLGSTTGSIVGNVTDNGILAFDRSDRHVFSGTITGTGSLEQIRGGTTVLTGNNTYTGGTSITAGKLQLGDGGTTGSITGDVIDRGALVFNRGDDYTFRGIISGNGSVQQIGGGTLTLSAANTYSGGTVLDNGTLVIANASALGTGDMTVNGGVLTADPQPINVPGNYFQGPNGTLQLQIAGANPGQYDFLNVGGNATLGGTLKLVNLGFTPQAGESLTLVKTGGMITNAFANFIDPFTTRPGLSTIDLVYNKQSVVLEFLNIVPPVTPPPPHIITINFPVFARTPNQLAGAEMLGAVEFDPRVANIIGFFLGHPFTDIPNLLNLFSPDPLSSFYEVSFSGANIQRLTLENRLDEVRASAVSSNLPASISETSKDKDGKSIKNPVTPVSPSPQYPFSVWATGYGDFVRVDSDFNARGYKFTSSGFDLGVDYRFLDHFAVGVMGNYAYTWTDLRPGSVTINSGRGGLYASYFNAGYYLNAGVYGGYNTYDSSRHGLGGNATGNTDGSEWSGFLSTGYDFHPGGLTIGPIASLQYTTVEISGFTETGSLAPLNIHSESAESLRTDVGFRAFYQWQVGGIEFASYLKATWEHEYKYSALPIRAGFADIAGPNETFVGPVEGHDSAVISAGLSVEWTPRISSFASYDGQLGRGRYTANAVTGGVRVSW